MSPSPEIELHSPDLEDDNVDSPFADHTPFTRDGSHPSAPADHSHNRRAMSPALEKEEREFTQAASTLKQWKSQESLQKSEVTSAPADDQISEPIDESEENAALRNSEAAAALFGQSDARLSYIEVAFTSSPVIKTHAYFEVQATRKPLQMDLGVANAASTLDAEMGESNWAWDELKSPENVELDELEDMFESY